MLPSGNHLTAALEISFSVKHVQSGITFLKWMIWLSQILFGLNKWCIFPLVTRYATLFHLQDVWELCVSLYHTHAYSHSEFRLEITQDQQILQCTCCSFDSSKHIRILLRHLLPCQSEPSDSRINLGTPAAFHKQLWMDISQ